MSASAADERGSEAPETRAGSRPRLWRAVELLLVFGGVPVLMLADPVRAGRLLMPILFLAAGVCLIVLARDRLFDRRRLWGGSVASARDELRRILLRFAIGGLALSLLVRLVSPELFLALPRARPGLWILILVLYPVLSVYPQELVFRTFFFHRYALLLPRAGVGIVASAAAFGLAHVFFGSWIAPLLSTIGGALFATTYQRTGSTLFASLEHALWGDLIFTIGLGRFFYGGAIS